MQPTVISDGLQILWSCALRPETWVVASLFLCISVAEIHRRHFKVTKERSIKVLKIKDLRLKLLRSADISDQGRALAGDEPYFIRCGQYEELVISQPDQIHEFYHGDYKHHGKPRNFNFGELFGRFMGTAVGLRHGVEWRRIRKHFDPPFAFHAAAERIPRFAKEIDLWNSELAQDCQNGATDLVVRKSFRFVVLRLLSVHLYQDAFDDRIYWQLLELSETHDHVVHALMTCKNHDSKFWSRLPTRTRRLVDKFLTGWKSLNNEVIENARIGEWDCPLEIIARGYMDSNDITEEEFLSTLGEVLFANVDVSASVLSTIFTQLASNIAIQDELRTEVAHYKPDEDFEMSKYLNNSKTLLHRVIMESMRLAPAFWFAMPESTAEDKTIGCFKISANASVIIDNMRLNKCHGTWGADGDKFRPDTFLEVEPQALRCGFMRYGTGAASGRCLGKNVADVVFKMTTVAVIEKFRLETLVEGKKPGLQSGSPDVRFIQC